MPEERTEQLNNGMHWLYGTSWGAIYGIAAGARHPRALRAGLLFGAGVWAPSLVHLPAMKLAPPVWEQEPSAVAPDLSRSRSGRSSAESARRNCGYPYGMAKDHGSSIKNDKQYEGLRDKGMSKQRAAAISNANAGSDNAASKKGGRNSASGNGSSQSSKSSGPGSGGNRKQKQAAGRKGGKATASKS